jgi:DivIVA domain-containing protein
MMWFLAVLIVLAIGAVAVVASGQGAPLARAYDDRPDAVVPVDRLLTGADLKAVRFSTAVRGYRASEVDALLDRLAAQLDASNPPTPNSGTLDQ